MTEQTTERTGAEAHEEHPRCQVGSATDKPCWREATEKRWLDDGEPTLCAEHKRWAEVGEEADEHLLALDRMQEWIRDTVIPAEDEMLRSHADRMREDAERRYWPAAVALKAAELIANQPQGEKPLTEDQARYLATLLLRSDALIDALVVLDDAPSEVFGAKDRWTIVAALQGVVERETEELRLYKEELGIK